MSEGPTRRAVAEARFNEDRAGVSKVGGRSIHQFWVLLAPHFREVFLPPQRRSDDGGVSWTWREPVETKPLTPADFASVRERLAESRASFEENPVSPVMADVRGGGLSSQEVIDQVAARVKAMAEGLASKPDAALAEYVCRTESGVMVHSWGLAAAAKVRYPDAMESGVAGVILVAGKGSADNEVVIENAQGLRVARTVTDEKGAFAFPRINPGRYRLRVVSGPGKFPEKGVPVVVEKGETTSVEISSDDEAKPEAAEAQPSGGEAAERDRAARPRRRRRLGILAVAGMLLVGGGVYLIFRYNRPATEKSADAGHVSRMAPERFEAGAGPAPASGPAPAAAEGGLGASAEGSGPAGRGFLDSSRTNAVGDRELAVTPGAEKRTLGSKIEVAGLGKGPSGPSSFSHAETGNGVGDYPSDASIGAPNEAAMAGATGAGGVPAATDEAIPASAGAADASVTTPNAQKSSGRNPSPGNLPGTTSTPGGGGNANVLGNSGEKKGGGTPAFMLPPEEKAGGADAGGAAGASKSSPAASGDAEGNITANGGAAGAGEMGSGAGAEAVSSSAELVERPPAATTPDKPETTGKKDGAQATPGKKPKRSPGNQGQSAPTNPTNGQSPSAPTKSAEAQGGPASGADEAAETTLASGDEGAAAAGKSEKQSPENKTPSSARPGDSSSKPAPNIPAVKAKKEPPSSTRTSTAPAGKAGTSSTRVASASEKKKETPNTPTSAEGAADAAQAPVSPSEEKSAKAETPVPTPQISALSAGGNEAWHGVGTVVFGKWRLALARDQIVPTLPVAEGDLDQTESLTQNWVDEQGTRRPATLIAPQLRSGVAIKMISGSKKETLHWLIEPERTGVERKVDETRAELGWRAGKGPCSAVAVLMSGARAVARVQFGATGEASVELTKEARASWWLSASYADGEDPRTLGSPRYFWQVVKGSLAASAWVNDSAWDGGRGCRLEMVLNGSNPAGTTVELADRKSDWRLGAQLE